MDDKDSERNGPMFTKLSSSGWMMGKLALVVETNGTDEDELRCSPSSGLSCKISAAAFLSLFESFFPIMSTEQALDRLWSSRPEEPKYIYCGRGQEVKGTVGGI